MINGIDLMVEEHKYIKRMLIVLRKATYKILQGEEICYVDFEQMLDFVQNYADTHHHGKEEKFLFNRMVDEIGLVADKLINRGMMVEHDLGRLYMLDLKEALIRVKAGDDESKLDVIANAIAYTHLLKRHIEREDSAVYTFANRTLNKETLEHINKDCEDFESKMAEKNVQNKYIKILETLEQKYM